MESVGKVILLEFARPFQTSRTSSYPWAFKPCPTTTLARISWYRRRPLTFACVQMASIHSQLADWWGGEETNTTLLFLLKPVTPRVRSQQCSCWPQHITGSWHTHTHIWTDQTTALPVEKTGLCLQATVDGLWSHWECVKCVCALTNPKNSVPCFSSKCWCSLPQWTALCGVQMKTPVNFFMDKKGRAKSHFDISPKLTKEHT